VYVYYPAKLATGGRRREKLIQGSVNIGANARIIVEPTLSAPIQYT
jgi:hypothetical protein